MADFITLEITGLAGVEQRLKDIGPKLARRGLRRALNAAVNVLSEEITNRTPVEHGDLIAAAQTKTSVSARDGQGTALFGYGNQGYKARLVEHGHDVKPKPKRKGKLEHVPAHPFIRPGFDTAAPAAVEAFTEVIREEIDS